MRDAIRRFSRMSWFESRAQTVGTVGDGMVSGVALARTEQGVNPNVLDAAERWRNFDASCLSDMEAALTTKTGEFGNSHLLDALMGYTAEGIAAPKLDATLPNATNVQDLDFSVGIDDYQVKVGVTAARAGLEAARENPDLTIVTNPDAARIIISAGFKAIGYKELETDRLRNLVEQHTAAIGELSDMIPEIPYVSLLLACIRQAKQFAAGDIALLEAAANVSVAVGSRSFGIYVTALAAAALFDVPSCGLLPVGLSIAGASGSGIFENHIVKSGLVRRGLKKSEELLMSASSNSSALVRSLYRRRTVTE